MTPEQLAAATGATLARATASHSFQAVEHIGRGNPSPKPFQDALLVYSSSPACGAYAGIKDAIKLHCNKAALVLHSLLRLCRPSAIPRLIVSSVSQPVNGVFWCGLLPHVIKEGGEVVGPPVADSNSFPAVSGPSLVQRIEASSFHGRPSHVLGTGFPAFSMAMLSDRLHCFINKCAAEACNPFFGLASATQCLSNLELPGEGDLLISAFASTQPSGVSAFQSWQWLQDCKPSKNGTGKIDFAWHSRILSPLNYGAQHGI